MRSFFDLCQSSLEDDQKGSSPFHSYQQTDIVRKKCTAEMFVKADNAEQAEDSGAKL